ncbi:AsmA family protein [Maridesulfovibrio bastinii]|uniref:AsmA family protein n=1 Tax=Maridesulfovibrio bastinii TaxID=47157 RepID=UPI000404E576|nr:AsmA family protein [Maridesulfovibrio bastinii]
MNRPAKIIVTLAAALVAVIAAAMILVTIFVNPNDYKDQISKIVYEKTGRQLTFQGDISLSVFPWIGVATQGITFSNAEGFGQDPMLSLKSADVSLRLLPLLSGSIALGDISVDGLQVNLMRNSKGINNWDDLTGAKAGEKNDTAEVTEPENSGDSGSAIDLSIGGLEVEDARIVWDDRKENVRQSIDDCDIVLGSVKPGSPFDFKVHVKLASTSPDIKADTNLSGIAKLDLERKIYELSGLKVEIDASGAAVPGKTAKVVVGADAYVDLDSGKAELKNIDANAYGAKLTGEAAASGFNNNKLAFNSSFDVPDFNLASTLKMLGLEIKTSDSKALTNVGLNISASGTDKSVNIKSVQLNLDDTTAKGSMSFANPERPDIRCDLNVDKINIDRYLPPSSENKKSSSDAEASTDKASAKKDSTGKEELLPVDLLRKLTLDSNLEIGELVIGGAKLEKILVKATSAGGVFKIKPASLNVAGGSFASTASIDASGKIPQITAGAKLSGLDGAKLSMQLNGEKKFAGIIGFETSLKTMGNDMKTVFANLDGNFGFTAKDGYVSGFDVLFLANDAFSVLTGKDMSKGENDKTEFGSASATAKITKGVAVNKDLTLKSPLLRASGEGLMNLNDMKLDYKLDAKIVGTLEGQGGKNQKDLIGLTVPLDISGPVSDPSIMVNLPRFAKAVAAGGFGIVSDVLKGVGGIVEGLGNAITGKKSTNDSGSTSKESKPEKAVEELGNALKGLFN